MKRLTILRHGKAQESASPDDDFTRALHPKGAKELKRLKRPLKRARPAIDLIIASSAARTRDSAEVVAAEIGYDGRILLDDELYEATPSTVLHILSNIPEDAEHLLLVGHNPAAEGLVSGLCAGSSQRMNVDMPTGGLAQLKLEIFWWQQIRWGCGSLQALVRPSMLKTK